MPEQGMAPPAGSGKEITPIEGDNDYDDSVIEGLEKHLDSLPDDQKKFLIENLTPETAVLIGIVNGREVYDYLSKYVNPAKTIQIIDKPDVSPAQPSQAGAEPQPAQAAGGATAPFNL
jgi:hypothetical protein